MQGGSYPPIPARSTQEDALTIDFIGATSACTSVGAISTAAGCDAVTESTIGICSGAEKSTGP